MMGASRFAVRWLAYWPAVLVAVLVMGALSGCFDKEASQRKAFTDFLQNTVMRSGETLPVLSVNQQQQFGGFVSYYMLLFHYSQQVNQAMNEGVYPLVAAVNDIRQPQDYVSQSAELQQLTDALAVLNQQLVNAKMQADSSKSALKLADDLRPVYEHAYQKIVTMPASALQPLLLNGQNLARQLAQVGEFIRQQGDDARFEQNGVQFPTAQQAEQYNVLIAPLASQYQAFNQAYQLALNALK